MRHLWFSLGVKGQDLVADSSSKLQRHPDCSVLSPPHGFGSPDLQKHQGDKVLWLHWSWEPAEVPRGQLQRACLRPTPEWPSHSLTALHWPACATFMSRWWSTVRCSGTATSSFASAPRWPNWTAFNKLGAVWMIFLFTAAPPPPPPPKHFLW